MVKKPEYLKFVELDSHARKTRIIEVQSERSEAVLGQIVWYGNWRQYVFTPEDQTIFNPDCLREIADRVERMTREHREIARRGRIS